MNINHKGIWLVILFGLLTVNVWSSVTVDVSLDIAAVDYTVSTIVIPGSFASGATLFTVPIANGNHLNGFYLQLSSLNNGYFYHPTYYNYIYGKFSYTISSSHLLEDNNATPLLLASTSSSFGLTSLQSIDYVTGEGAVFKIMDQATNPAIVFSGEYDTTGKVAGNYSDVVTVTIVNY